MNEQLGSTVENCAANSFARRLLRKPRVVLGNVWIVASLFTITFARQPDSQAEEYLWIPGSVTWSTSAPSWLDKNGVQMPWPTLTGNVDALFKGAGETLQLGSDVFVNDLFVTPASGTAAYTINGTSSLALGGPTLPSITVALNSSLTINAAVTATSGFAKLGAGTLTLSSTGHSIFDHVDVLEGRLQSGLATSTGGNFALSRAALNIGSSATVASGGSTAANLALWTGGLSGSGTLTTRYASTSTIGALTISLFEDQQFSGSVTATGLNVRGTGIQTFSGNLSGVSGPVVIESGAGVKLSGSAAISGSAFTLRGGELILDNSEVAADRISAAMNMRSGRLAIIGNHADLNESLGELNIATGHSTIIVENATNSPAQTSLSFSSFVRPYDGTVDFVLGNDVVPGSNSSISLASTSQWPLSNKNGLFAIASNAGFATLNGRGFAGYSNGKIIEVQTSPFPQTGSPSVNALLTENASISPSAVGFSLNSLTINPSATDQALTISGGNLRTTAILLTGANKQFEIRHTETGGIAGDATRFIHVPEATSSLLVSGTITSQHPLVKAGDGLLALSANNAASSGALIINAGIVRAEASKLPAGLLRLRGGVLEIANGNGGTGTGADFRRPLGTGTGQVNWTEATSNSGDGGFAAYGNDATVNIGGKATPDTLTWDTGGFVPDGHALILSSTRADRRITVLNNIALDAGGSGTTPHLRTFEVLGNMTSASDVARIAGRISGSTNAELLKTGVGTLELTGTSDFTGHTIIRSGALQIGSEGGAGAGNGRLSGTQQIVAHQGGSLLLGGSNSVHDRIHDNAGITLDGGTIQTNGLSEYTLGGGGEVRPGVGALTLLNHSILDFGGGDSTFAFADSSHLTWSGILNIYNYGAGDRLFFGENQHGLTSTQQSMLRFFSDAGNVLLPNPTALPTGELVVVPEPGTALTLGTLLIALSCFDRRRSRRTAPPR